MNMKLFIERVLWIFIFAAVTTKVVSYELFDGLPASETGLPEGETEEVFRPDQPAEHVMDLLRRIQSGQEESGQLIEDHGVSSTQISGANSETEHQNQDYGSSVEEGDIVVPVVSLSPPRQSLSDPNDQLGDVQSGEVIGASGEPEGGSQAVMHAHSVTDGAEGGLDEGDLEEDGPGGEGGQPVNLVVVPFSERQQVYFLEHYGNLLSGLDREQARVETFQEWSRERGEIFSDTLFQELARQNLAIVRLPDESEEGNLQYYVVCVTCDHYLGRAESFLRFYQCQGVGHRSCLSRDKRKQQEERTGYRLTNARFSNNNYSSGDVRISSYSKCPPLLSDKKEALSNTGFYYIGLADLVRCYCCGLGLRGWKEDDNPPVEHYRWRPNCEHLLKKFNKQELRRSLIVMQHNQLASAEHQQTDSHRGVDQNHRAIDENRIAGTLLDMEVYFHPSLLQEVIDRAPSGANENQIASTYLDAQPDHERKNSQKHSAKPSDSEQLKRGGQRTEHSTSRPDPERQAHLNHSPVLRAAVASETREANQFKPKTEVKRQPGKTSVDRKPESKGNTVIHSEGGTVIESENGVQIGRSNRVIKHGAGNRKRVAIENEVYQAAENMIVEEFGQVNEELFNSIAVDAITGPKKIGAGDILKSYKEVLEKMGKEKSNGNHQQREVRISSGLRERRAAETSDMAVGLTDSERDAIAIEQFGQNYVRQLPQDELINTEMPCHLYEELINSGELPPIGDDRDDPDDRQVLDLVVQFNIDFFKKHHQFPSHQDVISYLESNQKQ